MIMPMFLLFFEVRFSVEDAPIGQQARTSEKRSLTLDSSKAEMPTGRKNNRHPILNLNYSVFFCLL